MIFYESDMKFEFDDAHWHIKKYDTHHYYKILAGRGLKGVDFVGILDQQKVVFFEIKNFHTNLPTSKNPFLILEDPKTFISNIADKLEDSVRAIDIIITLLKRKKWYQFFLKWQRFIPILFIKNKDWYFWHQIHQIGLDKKRQTLVLWLEIDSPISAADLKKLKASIDISLEQELSEFVGEVLIADKKYPVFTNNLTVTN